MGLRTLLKILLVMLLAAAAWLAWGLLLPLKPSHDTFVLLRPGFSTRRIARELHNAGVIRSAHAFVLWHYLAKPRSLRAGEYLFDQSANALQVRRRLARGDIYVHTVIIPEGYNIFDIAGVMEAAGLASRQEFLQAARADTSLISDLDPQAQSLEGYLFPDTYQFTRTQTLQDMIAVMVHRFRQEAQNAGLTSDFHRLVTMASIIEKETAVAEERPLVASVYYNRLQHNIALDADPCVIYAALLAGHYQGAIQRADLQSDSRYNTYKYPGLPPGPIANPGVDSLRTALHPAASAYFYFVSDNQGHHRFARTLEEHNHNVAAYRKALRNASVAR